MSIAASRPQERAFTRVSEPRPVRGSDETLRVLCIDDEPSLCALLKEFLQMMGHDCETASSGEEGLEKALTSDFDAIICDMHLPGISGADVCRTLLSEKPSLSGRLLVATGDLLGRETHEFFAQTGLPHIHKPFKLQELNAALLGLTRAHPAEVSGGSAV